MKRLALIIAFLLIAPPISMAQETYVVNVMVNDEPVREINGVAYVAFDSEYKLLIKNNTDSRCSARVYIDGSRVSPGGDFVIDSHDKLTLERFVTDMDSGKKFKFVPLDNPAIDDPSRAGNGIIRVEFRKENLSKYESSELPTTDNWGDCDTWTYDGEKWHCLHVWHTFFHDLNLIDGVIYTSGLATEINTLDTNVTLASDSIPNGATIAGSESTQRFHKVDYDFDESFVEVKLMIKGLE